MHDQSSDLLTSENAISWLNEILPSFEPTGESGNRSHFWCYREAAKQLGLRISEKGEIRNFYRGKKRIGQLFDMRVDFVKRDANSICRSKSRMSECFSRANIPSPVHRGFSTSQFNDALGYAQSRGFNVVMKPDAAKGGQGITVDIADEKDFKTAWEAAAHYASADSSILIEERLKGVDVRVIVANGEFICAATRIPAHIIGDGIHNIDELISIKNETRNAYPYYRTYPICAMEYFQQGDGLARIPLDGEIVMLQDVSNIHQGGESYDVTDLVGEEVRNIAIAAANSVAGLNVAGVDLFTTSYTDPSKVYVLELNVQCNFGLHCSPIRGQARNPARAVLEAMLKRPEKKWWQKIIERL
jgi:cyanophycin synthetase